MACAFKSGDNSQPDLNGCRCAYIYIYLHLTLGGGFKVFVLDIALFLNILPVSMFQLTHFEIWASKKKSKSLDKNTRNPHHRPMDLVKLARDLTGVPPER